MRGEVEFEHVRFSYPDNPDKIIIKDFSAHILPGQRWPLSGPPAREKTTMVNLLMRFYELSSGSILNRRYAHVGNDPGERAQPVQHGVAGYLDV